MPLQKIISLQFKLLLASLGFCALGVYADGIPTLDLSENHSYSQIAKDGILVSKPPRGSQGILNKEFKIKIANGKELTFNSGGLLYCAPADTNIQFISLNTSCSTVEETKEEIQKLSFFFSWTTNDFSQWIAKAEKPKWLKMDESKLPYHVVEVYHGGLKETPQGVTQTPYGISILLTWDVNILERQSPEAGMFRVKKEFEANQTAVASEPPVMIPVAPEKIVKLYLDLLSKKNFMQVARLLDSDGIKHFRQIYSYFDHGSGSEFGDGLRKGCFGKDATPENIAKLSDEEFIGKWMQSSALISAALMGVDSSASSNVEIIGSVPEGTNKLHVLVRMHSKDQYTGNMVSVLVLTSLCKQADGDWKVEVSDGVLNSAESNAKRIKEK